jgi:septal ring factor EnvC (AmiA/AmiB activator)
MVSSARVAWLLLVPVLAVAEPPSPVPSPAPAPFDARIEQESAELERVRNELDHARKEASTYVQRESQVLGQLNELDSALALQERLLAGLTRKEDRLRSELALTRERVERERDRLEERRGILRRRLRNIYKVGEQPGLQAILGATSAVDLVRRFDWLLLVAAQDRNLYDDVQESVQRVREAEAELARKMGEVAGVRAESEQEKADLVLKKDERRTLLDSVRNEKSRKQRVVTELEQAEQQLQHLLAELEEKAKSATLGGDLPPGGTGFAAAKGRLPWPAAGKVTRWFGVQKDKRFGTSTFNGGLDIEADRETEVIAVHSGRADYVNWLPGYGQCIILNHGDGYYTLYAHTSTVFVTAGDMVRMGDVIATVGDTGSLLGDVLHFEIRKDAEPINPAPWLGSTKLE